ncbi:MAG: hypothetical protein M1823_000099 [Watsoniomyces obsoletus]|nr:MAG: hypothetical protein M1823_000099 [Watsoniomyces obsoletus]
MPFYPPPASLAPGATNPRRREHVELVEARTEQATQALQRLHISGQSMISLSDHYANAGAGAGAVRGTASSLAIPLDGTTPYIAGAPAVGATPNVGFVPPTAAATTAYPPRREPLRRDSLKRREALLRGKEGSRRRQRWENDHLLNNPYAQPPLPSDWEVRPTYPRHSTLPYHLAQMWDEHQLRLRSSKAGGSSSSSPSGNSRATSKRTATMDGEAEKLKAARDVRARLKRARAARGMLQDLEEDIRGFVKVWVERRQQLLSSRLGQPRKVDGKRKSEIGIDSEDEEIVFVGRDGRMKGDSSDEEEEDEEMVKVGDNQDVEDEEEGLEMVKMVLNTLIDDRDAAFRRWLVHSIATYYGLRTWSVTVGGDPVRREAYVGIQDDVVDYFSATNPSSASLTTGGPVKAASSAALDAVEKGFVLPQPLWGLV